MPLIATLVAAAAASTLQGACSWDQPGQHPFMGDVPAAVDDYPDIPAARRERLKDRLRRHDYDDVVWITRDGIHGSANYGPELTGMHFGTHRVCERVSRTRWRRDHREMALAYCEGTECIVVPTVCRNVSRVVRRAPPAAAAPPAAQSPPGPLVFAPPSAGGPPEATPPEALPPLLPPPVAPPGAPPQVFPPLPPILQQPPGAWPPALPPEAWPPFAGPPALPPRVALPPGGVPAPPAVPEPPTAALLLGGFLLLAGRRVAGLSAPRSSGGGR